MNFVGKQHIADLTNSTGLTPPEGSTPNLALVQARANDVYVTFDGTEPSDTNGFLLKEDTEPMRVTSFNFITQLRLKQVSPGAKAAVMFFKVRKLPYS